MRIRKYIILVILIGVTGCTTNKQHATVAFDLMQSGDCASAYSYAKKNLGGNNLTMVQSGIAEFCIKDQKLALQYLKSCAENGHQYCIDSLIEKGIKPPPLIEKGMSGAEFMRRLGNAGQAYNESMRQSQPQSPIRCNSQSDGMGGFSTVCR